jgi:hypothetical protein
MTKQVDNKTGRHCLSSDRCCPFLCLGTSPSKCTATASCELSERAVMASFEWASRETVERRKP